jgi:hypothetical protein
MSTETKKQTAVDWLVSNIDWLFAIKNPPWQYKMLLEQAKTMEKEQIVKAVYDSMGTNFDPNMGRAELYYNETYGKGNI